VSVFLRKVVIFLTALLASSVSTAFTEGVEYTRYSINVLQQAPIQQWLKDNPGKVQVIEFFSFACPRCNSFELSVQKWVVQKPETVVFWKVPVIFHPNWRPLAKASFRNAAASEIVIFGSI
jgi:protein-disulfide isomerase